MEIFLHNSWITFDIKKYQKIKKGSRFYYYYDNVKLPRRIKIQATSIASNSLIEAILFNSELDSFTPLTKQEKMKQTILKRYGAENYNNREKMRQTNLKKYGVEHSFQRDDVKEKIVKTNLKKYGVECVFQSEEIKEKIKQTNLQIYGHEYAAQNTIIKNKIKQTNLKKYGVEYSIVEKGKREEGMIKKYGINHPMKIKSLKEKAKQTNLERYGVENVSQNKSIKNKKGEKRRKEAIDHVLNRIDGIVTPMFKIDDTFNVGYYDTLFRWKCEKCGNIFKDFLYAGNVPRCLDCYPKSKPFSLYEKEILHYMESLGYDVEENTRKVIPPKELDIYLPKEKLAIEVNGLFWHGIVNNLDKNYHLKKTISCKEKGVRLLHIYEGEDYIDKIQNFLNPTLENKNLITLDRDLGLEMMYEKNGYKIVEEIEPKKLNFKKHIVHNSGQVILKFH